MTEEKNRRKRLVKKKTQVKRYERWSDEFFFLVSFLVVALLSGVVIYLATEVFIPPVFSDGESFFG